VGIFAAKSFAGMPFVSSRDNGAAMLDAALVRQPEGVSDLEELSFHFAVAVAEEVEIAIAISLCTPVV
jgi:hypothetical protein